MDGFSIAAKAVIPFVVYIGFGMGVRRTGLVDEPFYRKLNSVIFYCFYPIVSFCNIYGAGGDGIRLQFLALVAASVLVCIGLCMLAVPRFIKAPAQQGVVVQALYRSNILLFALPLLDGDSEIRMLSRLESKPYVDLTIACLRHFGVTVYETEQGYTVPGGQQYHACDMEVEGDYSQAAFFYVANALGSDITLTNLNPESVQGDKKIVEITQQMCYNREKGLPACFDVDAADIPDLVPILAVLATFGTAPSRITGAHRLTIKESDRLASTADLLNRLGGKVTAPADGLELAPVEPLPGGPVDSCGAHRIAMCAAVAATRCTGEVTILHGECVEKSYPRFYEDYRQLGGIANVIVLES